MKHRFDNSDPDFEAAGKRAQPSARSQRPSALPPQQRIAAVLATAQNVNGSSPPAAPEVSGAVNASYRFDSAVGSFTPRVEVVYRGEQWARIFNTAIDKMDAYTVVNAGLEFLPSSNENFRVTLTGTNLFDKDGINSRFIDPYGTFQVSNQYIPPRQVLATVAFKY